MENGGAPVVYNGAAVGGCVSAKEAIFDMQCVAIKQKSTLADHDRRAEACVFILKPRLCLYDERPFVRCHRAASFTGLIESKQAVGNRHYAVENEQVTAACSSRVVGKYT